MGPNVLWLTEWLAESLELSAGMRVLDLGCGKALSSIFLAKEFDVHVAAVDLWIDAASNWKRIQEANAAELVMPIHAEAHNLPFADEYFDAMVSLDAYHYFGTDDLYIGYCRRFLRRGGRLGIVVPGLVRELGEALPDHLVSRWEWDFCSFHSPEWWRRHWEKTGLMSVEQADMMPEGWRHWLTWLEVAADNGYPSSESETEMLRADRGTNLGFTRVIGRRRAV